LIDSCERLSASVPAASADGFWVRTCDKSVMVIEDNSELRRMLSELLYAIGYSVFAAGDAGNAFAIAQSLRPSVVLCDVILPSGSGIEMAERLGQDPQTRRIPVVLMSGHVELLEHRPANQRWLAKPFTTSELTAALRQAVMA
jgi:CheY-like chemotaxis protein